MGLSNHRRASEKNTLYIQACYWYIADSTQYRTKYNIHSALQCTHETIQSSPVQKVHYSYLQSCYRCIADSTQYSVNCSQYITVHTWHYQHSTVYSSSQSTLKLPAGLTVTAGGSDRYPGLPHFTQATFYHYISQLPLLAAPCSTASPYSLSLVSLKIAPALQVCRI